MNCHLFLVVYFSQVSFFSSIVISSYSLCTQQNIYSSFCHSNIVFSAWEFSESLKKIDIQHINFFIMKFIFASPFTGTTEECFSPIFMGKNLSSFIDENNPFLDYLYSNIINLYFTF